MQATKSAPFYKSTFATFKKCARPRRNPDFVSDSGSEYWYDEKTGKVTRYADHWETVASCHWKVKGGDEYYEGAASCKLADFKQIAWGSKVSDSKSFIALLANRKTVIVDKSDIEFFDPFMYVGGMFVDDLGVLLSGTFTFA